MPARTRTRAQSKTRSQPKSNEPATIADSQNSPEHLEGPITRAYQADPDHVIRMLNALRSTEIVAYLQYKQHAYMAVSLIGPGVKGEFLEHADQELHHADMLAERIQQIGGIPVYDLVELGEIAEGMKVKAQQGATLEQMVMEDLALERKQVVNYTDFIREVSDKDPVTRRVLEDILIDTEHHASELRDMLQHRAESHGEESPANGRRRKTSGRK